VLHVVKRLELGRIKMKLDVQVKRLCLGDIVLDEDGTQLPPPRKGAQQRATFAAHVYCGQNGWMDQDAIWYGGIGICLGTIFPSLKGAQPPVFGPCL